MAGTIHGFLQEVANIARIARGTIGTPLSLSEVTKSSRVEPITIIGQDLQSTPEMSDIMHGVLNIFTGFYLQAVSLLTAEVQGVNIRRILETVNPDRDLDSTLSAHTSNVATLSIENYKYKLPNLSLELRDIIDDEIEGSNSAPVKGNQKNALYDSTTLSVGKLLDISIQPGNGIKSKETMVFNVSVRLASNIIPEDVIAGIIAHDKGAYTFSERWEAFKGGRITFFKDLLFASDLIDNQKKIMKSDPTGIYTEILKRVNNSRIYSAATDGISLSGVSSIYVISEATEKALKRKFGAGLENKRVRNIVFTNSMAMLLVVVDREWERVTIYSKGIEASSQNKFKDFKNMSSSASKGPDIADVLKAFSGGNAPSF